MEEEEVEGTELQVEYKLELRLEHDFCHQQYRKFIEIFKIHFKKNPENPLCVKDCARDTLEQ